MPLILILALFAHGQSKSFAVWTFAGRQAELLVNFAAHDVKDQPSLGTHVVRNTSLTGCTAGAPIVRESGPDELQVKLTFECDAATQRKIALTYLPGRVPPHVTHATVAGAALGYEHLFGPESPTLTIMLPPDRTTAFIGLGVFALLATLAIGLKLRRR